MRLTAILLLAGLGAGARGFSQITLSEKNTPLRNVFKKIQQQSGFEFLYPADLVEKAGTVTVEVRDATLEDALDATLTGKGLSFVISDRSVIIRQSAAPPGVPLDTGRVGAIRVKGVVLTEAGVPVQGANVTIKKTEHGTITNAKGEFELSSVPVGGVLVISYVGYAPQTYTVKDGSQIRIYMKVAQNELDKAVVQAYGTTTQRLTTSDIGKVTADQIEKQTWMNPLLALQGQVAGLDVNQTSGYASAPVKVELRGRATINSIFTSDPLYIIDAVPMTVNELYGRSSYANGSVGFAQILTGPAGGQSPFFSINPADIESIEVLKDADATAIYGSRGANGVIIVSTKKGKAGKTKFDLNVQDGTTHVDRFWDMMNTTQYLAMRRQAFYNSGTIPSSTKDFDINGTWDTTKYTNWQKKLYGGVGKTVNVQGSLSGGDARTTFRVSGGYDRTIGITTVSGADQRASVDLSFTHRSLDQRLSISTSNTFSYAQSDMISLPGNVLMAPDAPAVYDSIGNLNWAAWGGKTQNRNAESDYPFGGLKQPYIAKTDFLNSSLHIGYELLRGLQVSTSLGYNIAQQNQVNTYPIASMNPLNSPTGMLMLGNNHNINWLIEPQIDYNTQISKGKLAILVGASSDENNTESLFVEGSGYQSDLLINNISSAGSFSATDASGEYRYFGVFGRISFSWADKYLLDLNARRDGSSRFGPGKQFGNFGSVGAAWIASEEEWVKKAIPSIISLIKLRGSFGTTGSDGVPDYSFISQYSSNGVFPYDNGSALLSIINPNPDFRWQSNKKLEGAINLSFFNDRINLQTVWYRNRSSNQLVPFPTPLFTGFGSVIENSPALVQNAGWEFTISANLLKTKKCSWTINFNAAINRNKLIAYPDFSQSPFAYGANALIIGQPLNITHVLHFTGVDPQTGQYAFLDKNHGGEINWNPGHPNDDSYPLVLAPKLFGGLGMNFGYEGLTISLFFNLKDQIGKNAYTSTAASAGTFNNNESIEILGKQWQYPGDKGASVAEFSTVGGQLYEYFNRYSDGANTNASFIRLSNLSVSYALPASYLKKAGIQSCNLFFHTNNLLIITHYKGLDPETQNFGGLPPVKAVVGGIDINL